MSDLTISPPVLDDIIEYPDTDGEPTAEAAARQQAEAEAAALRTLVAELQAKLNP